ncbi:MAG: hypothetical protein ABSB75_06315, partial [Candidatus Limnocylindrales bacterium]
MESLDGLADGSIDADGPADETAPDAFGSVMITGARVPPARAHGVESVLPYSSKSGLGHDELWKRLRAASSAS